MIAGQDDSRRQGEIREGLSVDEIALPVAMLTIFAAWMTLLVLMIGGGLGGASPA